ncbi:MAG: hypothetical protein WA838_17260, partial [Xanthobacteraceae bacterium]
MRYDILSLWPIPQSKHAAGGPRCAMRLGVARRFTINKLNDGSGRHLVRTALALAERAMSRGEAQAHKNRNFGPLIGFVAFSHRSARSGESPWLKPLNNMQLCP